MVFCTGEVESPRRGVVSSPESGCRVLLKPFDLRTLAAMSDEVVGLATATASRARRAAESRALTVVGCRRLANCILDPCPPPPLPAHRGPMRSLSMHEYTASESLRKHMLAVEAAMRAYAEHFGEDPERWGLAGLIHDFDYERFPNAAHSATEEHPVGGRAHSARARLAGGHSPGDPRPRDVLQRAARDADGAGVVRRRRAVGADHRDGAGEADEERATTSMRRRSSRR